MLRYAIVIIGLAQGVAADVTSGGRTVECFCTDGSGTRVELGQFTCLQVDGRMFTAQCQMSLNVPMWRELQDGCLTGALSLTLQERLKLLHPVLNTRFVHIEI